MSRILLVEDEPAIADTLVYALKSESHEVVHALTGEDALNIYHQKKPIDFVILDIGLPDISGFDVCRAIRQEGTTPILFLTARESELDRVLGLEMGGDDYVVKPFSPREIVARVRAIMRRSGPPNHAPSAAAANPSHDTHPQPLTHDTSMMKIAIADQLLDLTMHEYKLLLVFIEHPNRVLTRDQLLERAWEDPRAVTDRTIDAHIKMIRAKLRDACDAAELIQTRRGLGYVYVPENWKVYAS